MPVENWSGPVAGNMARVKSVQTARFRVNAVVGAWYVRDFLADVVLLPGLVDAEKLA